MPVHQPVRFTKHDKTRTMGKNWEQSVSKLRNSKTVIWKEKMILFNNYYYMWRCWRYMGDHVISVKIKGVEVAYFVVQAKTIYV